MSIAHHSVDFSLGRLDLLLTSSLHRHTAILLPSSKEKKQKVVVGDDSGTLQSFTLKKTVPESLFKLQGNRREVTAVTHGNKDRLYIAFGQTIQCLNKKKGTLLGSYTSVLNEDIHHIAVDPNTGTIMYVACEYSFNAYEIGKNLEKVSDQQFWQSGDRINHMIIASVMGNNNTVQAILACQDRYIRVIQDSMVVLEHRVDGPVSVLYALPPNTNLSPPMPKTGDQPNQPNIASPSTRTILYGTENGHFGQIIFDLSSKSPVIRPGFLFRNENFKKSGINCLTSAPFHSIGAECVCIGRDDGLLEVYLLSDFLVPDLLSEPPRPLFHRELNESIVSLQIGNIVSNDTTAMDLLVATYSGKVMCFSPEIRGSIQVGQHLNNTAGNANANNSSGAANIGAIGAGSNGGLPPLEREKSSGLGIFSSFRSKNTSDKPSADKEERAALMSDAVEGEKAIAVLKQEIDKLKEKVEKEKEKYMKAAAAAMNGAQDKADKSPSLGPSSSPSPPGAIVSGATKDLISPELIATESPFKVKTSFQLVPSEAAYRLTIEIPHPLDSVAIQTSGNLLLLDSEANHPSILLSWTQGSGSAAENGSEKDNKLGISGGYLTGKDAAQWNTQSQLEKDEIVAVYRFSDPKEVFSRLEIRLRTMEGPPSQLNLCVLPKYIPKTAQFIQIPIKPLSLHERIDEKQWESEFQTRQFSSFQLQGQFSLNEIHQWLGNCFPEFPSRIPNDSAPQILAYQSTFTKSMVFLEYSKGLCKIRSDSPSTIAILKEFLTREATTKRVQIEPQLSVNPASIEWYLGLLRLELDKHFNWKKKLEWISPLQELSQHEDPQVLRECLSDEYRDILENAENIQLQAKQSPRFMEFLQRFLIDFYLDCRKLQGHMSGHKVARIEEAMKNYEFDKVCATMKELLGV